MGDRLIYLYRCVLVNALIILVVSTGKVLFSPEMDLSSPPTSSHSIAEQDFPKSEIHGGYCAAPPDVDLGDISCGAPALSVFCINNDGAVSLKIISMQKSCHCLDINIEPGTVVPCGKHLKFVVRMPMASIGRHSATLTVATDSPSSHLQALRYTLTATIQPKVDASLSDSTLATANGR